MSKPHQVTIRWTFVLAVVAAVFAGIFGVTATGKQPQASAAPGDSEAVWNSPDNPNYPRLPTLIAPPRGGDPVARP